MQRRVVFGTVGIVVGAAAAATAGFVLGGNASDGMLTLVAALALGFAAVVIGLSLGARRPRPLRGGDAPVVADLDEAAARIATRRAAERGHGSRPVPATPPLRRRRGTAIGTAALRLGAEWETATLHLSAARYWFELDDGWGIPLGAETGSSDAGRYSLSDLDALWRHGRFHLDPQRMLDRDTAIVRNPAGDRLFAGRPHPR